MVSRSKRMISGSRKRPRKKKAVPRKPSGKGEICAENPLCYRFDVEFDPNTIELTSIDLFDPTITGVDDPYLTVTPPFEQGAEQGARGALGRAATNGQFDTRCFDVRCKCKLAGAFGAWSPWSVVEISGGFSIPAPNPPPPRLRYRANGKVKARSRMEVGVCYRIALMEQLISCRGGAIVRAENDCRNKSEKRQCLINPSPRQRRSDRGRRPRPQHVSGGVAPPDRCDRKITDQVNQRPSPILVTRRALRGGQLTRKRSPRAWNRRRGE
jgi:hypothetical protein